ncbi:MAG TPA: VWA domain-containing protein, partial [Armatimonadetes bacterium]|nr:VWA domain-containing protein [Armatimonadota bacterium]
RYGLVDITSFRRRLSLALRIIIVALLIAALAGAQVVLGSHLLTVIFAIDVSKSLTAKQREAAIAFVNQAAKEMRRFHRAGVIAFGGDALIEKLPSVKLELKTITSIPTTQYTDIAAAIRLAMATFPPHTQKRIVLLSDGGENSGDALREAIVAKSHNIPIDVVPLAGHELPEVVAEKLVMPNEVKKGEPFQLRITLKSNVSTNAKVRLFRDNTFLRSVNVTIDAGTKVIVLSDELKRPGFHTYEIKVDPETDAEDANNRLMGFVLVRGKPKVLYVESEPTAAKYLLSALEEEDVDVDLVPAERMPSRVTDLENYEAIILSNVPASSLTDKQLQQLYSLVTDMGIGLVVIGGEQSYAMGAYQNTPLEKVLPVDMRVRQRRVIPRTAIVMIMHSCEFPGGNQWAATTAIQVVRMLNPMDLVGMLYYDFQKGNTWLFPLQKAGTPSNRRRLIALIKQFMAGDMPDFDSTLKMAYSSLKKSRAQAKHIIILSDGDPTPPTTPVLKAL